ncbi:MAG: hypothetical protein RIQ54_29 [Candidatus Parcubacteria bacterium]|jgi:hypothetical protein
MEVTINYAAVITAAIVNMAVGMLWYGPLFGRQWQKLMEFTPESMKSMKLTPVQAMLGGVVTALLLSVVLANDAFVWANFMNDSGTAIFALKLAFWIWLGYVATTQAGSFLWEGKPFALFVLNAAESFVALLAMSLVLVLWK